MPPFRHFLFRPIDWLILGSYALFLVIIGFWPRKTGTEDYLIAGRRLGIGVFVCTLVATWYGAVLGAGEFVYTDGISAWTANGLPYYVFAAVFALLLARRVRGGAAGLYTVPDKLAREYDRKTALAGAAFAFLYASPGQYVLMVGLLLRAIFGWSLLIAMIAGAAFSVVYVVRGGFLADIRVNTLQFCLMFGGFTAAAVVCLQRVGVTALTASNRLPATHFTLLGTHNIAWAAVWFFIAILTLADPGFHQRTYAARTPRVAFWGILVAICCWMAFDALTTTTGLYARLLVPHLDDPVLAFPALAERILPAGAKGLFVVGMLAPIMAGAVSWTFLAAVTIGRDFIWRLSGDTTEDRVPGFTRLGLVATSMLAIGIAVAVPSVVEQWFSLGSIFVPAVLIPLLGAYAADRRWTAPSNYAFWSMLVGGALAAASLAHSWRSGEFDPARYILGWQPMYLGLLGCALVYAAGLAASALMRARLE